MKFLMLRCPRLQQRVERHHKGLNLPNLFQIIMFRTHEQTYSSGKVFKYNFASPECVKGVTMMHPKWEVIPTFFIPLFRESKLSDYFHFTESISTWCQVSKTVIGDTSILFFLIFDHLKDFLHQFWRTRRIQSLIRWMSKKYSFLSSVSAFPCLLSLVRSSRRDICLMFQCLSGNQ